jgi:6-pyruvoyltetrahydropterin/6-carboxytetrahydropterin synthase
MYQISIVEEFEAAHYLRGYGGKCEKLHGHRYKVIVKLQSEKLNELGMVYDFVSLKGEVGEVIQVFDHTCLNDVSPFDKINPTAENISRVIYEALRNKIAIEIVSVEVWESPQNRAEYRPSIKLL